MYFALNQNSRGIDMYVSFLSNMIETKELSYKSIFDDVISNASKLVKSGNFYAVPSERFELISLLAEKELIDSLNVDNLQIEDYRKILKFLQTHTVS